MGNKEKKKHKHRSRSRERSRDRKKKKGDRYVMMNILLLILTFRIFSQIGFFTVALSLRLSLGEWWVEYCSHVITIRTYYLSSLLLCYFHLCHLLIWPALKQNDSMGLLLILIEDSTLILLVLMMEISDHVRSHFKVACGLTLSTFFCIMAKLPFMTQVILHLSDCVPCHR